MIKQLPPSQGYAALLLFIDSRLNVIRITKTFNKVEINPRDRKVLVPDGCWFGCMRK